MRFSKNARPSGSGGSWRSRASQSRDMVGRPRSASQDQLPADVEMLPDALGRQLPLAAEDGLGDAGVLPDALPHPVGDAAEVPEDQAMELLAHPPEALGDLVVPEAVAEDRVELGVEARRLVHVGLLRGAGLVAEVPAEPG